MIDSTSNPMKGFLQGEEMAITPFLNLIITIFASEKYFSMPLLQPLQSPDELRLYSAC